MGFAFLVSLVTGAAPVGAIDAFVQARLAKEKIPGLSLAIIQDSRVVYAKGYGLANVELKVPAAPESVYQSGSVGKQFTATAVMMLVEEGKIGLEDPIEKYFPAAPSHWKGITVRHLLSHTSGIKDYDIPLWHEYTEGDLFRAFAEPPLDFPPGEKWSYSNTGYALLGFLIEKVCGEFYGDFLKKRVFEPLGMSDTRIINEADIIPNRVAGYHLVGGVLKNQTWVSPSLNTTADGSLYFTVLDLAKWDAALNTDKLLKRSRLQETWTPAKLKSGLLAETPNGAYGFGWVTSDQRGHRLIEHGGTWQGFRTHIARYVDDSLTVIVLANLAEARPHEIAHGLAGIVVPSLLPPKALSSATDPDPAATLRYRAFAAQSSPEERKRLEADSPLLFLGCDDVRKRGLERANRPVASLCYYRLKEKEGTRSYKFWVGPETSVLGSYSEED